MARYRGSIRVPATVAVVIAVVVAGMGGVSPVAHETLPALEPADAAADLHRIGTVTGTALVSVRSHLQPVVATAGMVMGHPSGLLVLFELGLLVEHLRLLNRVDTDLAGGLQKSQATPDDLTMVRQRGESPPNDTLEHAESHPRQS